MNNRRSIIVALFLFGASWSSGQDVASRLDSLLTAYAGQYEFNGVALVSKGGRILLEKGYGYKNASGKVPNDTNSIFQIGSITKQFTATTILYLQEKGRLDVRDKLSKYIPDYPGGDRITIRHLLTHTSGIYNYTNDSRFMNNDAIRHIDLEKAIALFKEKPLEFEPGAKFSYSNSGYILLGYIIQKVSGKPYEQVVRETIFQPLGMLHSGFDFRNLRDTNRAVGYFVLDSTMKVPAPVIDSSASYAAGAIYTTAGDLYKWHKALYTDKIIRQSSLQQAWTPFLGKYGYGWFIDSLDGRKVITHNGGIFGFTADIMRIPADDICVILLCNKPATLAPVTRNLVHILYGLPYEVPVKRKEISLPDSVLRQYVGVYTLSNDFKITITLEDGHLKAQATGQPKVDLYAQRENFFFLKIVNAQVEFVRDASGTVQKAILYQGGARLEGIKTK